MSEPFKIRSDGSAACQQTIAKSMFPVVTPAAEGAEFVQGLVDWLRQRD